MVTPSIKTNYNVLIERLDAIRSCKPFEYIVIAVIIISALAIGVNTHDIPPYVISTLEVLNVFITVFFAVEIAIRMLVTPRFKDFFKSGWNVFDTIIVAGSLIPIDDNEMVLLARLLRIFRVLRLISFIPELRMLVGALLKAIPRMGYIVLLMFVIFYMYAAVGSMFFNTINPVLWGDISISMLTLFRVVTFEDWTDIMYETMVVYKFSWIYYLSFIFLASFVFLNMMIGVVIDVFSKEHNANSRENGEGEAYQVQEIYKMVSEMKVDIKELSQHSKSYIK
jgi:voltage-gated sodium channel